VRHHGDVARIEVPLEEISRLRELTPQVMAALRALGFQDVTVDPRGLRSGGLVAAALRERGEAMAARSGPEPPRRPPR